MILQLFRNLSNPPGPGTPLHLSFEEPKEYISKTRLPAFERMQCMNSQTQNFAILQIFHRADAVVRQIQRVQLRQCLDPCDSSKAIVLKEPAKRGQERGKRGEALGATHSEPRFFIWLRPCMRSMALFSSHSAAATWNHEA